MSSTAQILANRRNATQSSGPKSPEGKAISSTNSTRHGLSGAFTVLPHESQEDFDQLSAAIHSEYGPHGDTETFLVRQMIQDRWKLLRIERLEALAFEQILTEPGGADDPDGRILGAILTSGNPLDKLQRYSAAADRAFYKALRELEASRLRTHRTEGKAIDQSIKQAAAQTTMPSRPNAAVQNEPNRPGPKPLSDHERLNPALRL